MELSSQSPGDNYTGTLIKRKFGSVDGFKQLTDVKKATEGFENCFERAGIKAMDQRIKYAQAYYNQFANAGLGMGPATATSAEAYSGSGMPDSMNGWAYYKQADDRWGKVQIGGTTVGRAGCGPTSHAMMLTTMTGQRITPDIMTKWAYDKGVWGKEGMYHSMPQKVADTFGLNLHKSWTGKSDTTLTDIKNTIKAGSPVVMSGRTTPNNSNSSSPFSKGGHIVLAVGVDGSGNLIINDSRGPQYTKAYTDAGMKYGTGLRAAWAFNDNGGLKIPTEISTSGTFTGSTNTLSSLGTSTGSSSSTVDKLGVFGKLGTIGNNLLTNIYNGSTVAGMGKGGDGKTYWANGFGDKVSYKGSMGKGPDMTRIRTNPSNDETMKNVSSKVLEIILQELRAINNNTATTAKNTSKISIVGANESISGELNKSKNKSSSLRQPDNDTGYNVARQIASYR